MMCVGVEAMHLEIGTVHPLYALMIDVLCLLILVRLHQHIPLFRSEDTTSIQMIATLMMMGDFLAIPALPVDFQVFMMCPMVCLGFSFSSIFSATVVANLLESLLGTGGFLNLGINLIGNLVILGIFVFVVPRSWYSSVRESVKQDPLLRVPYVLVTLAAAYLWVCGSYYLSSCVFGYPPWIFVHLALSIGAVWLLLELVLMIMVIEWFQRRSFLFKEI